MKKMAYVVAVVAYLWLVAPEYAAAVPLNAKPDAPLLSHDSSKVEDAVVKTDHAGAHLRKASAQNLAHVKTLKGNIEFLHLLLQDFGSESISGMPRPEVPSRPLTPEDLLASVAMFEAPPSTPNPRLAICGEYDEHRGREEDHDVCGFSLIDAIKKVKEKNEMREQKLEEEEEIVTVALHSGKSYDLDTKHVSHSHVSQLRFLAKGGQKRVFTGMYEGEKVAISIGPQAPILEELVIQQTISTVEPTCGRFVLRVKAIFVPPDPELKGYIAVVMPLTQGDLSRSRFHELTQLKATALASKFAPSVVPSKQFARIGFKEKFKHKVGSLFSSSQKKGLIKPEDIAKKAAVLISATQMSMGLYCTKLAGYVHRDIKPDNYMWYEDTIVLHDFGISAKGCAKPPCHGPLDKAPGTPGYVPPNQPSAARSVYQHDIFSLGVTMYNLNMPNDVPGLDDMVRSMLDWDYKQRPTVEEVLIVLRSLYIHSCINVLMEQQEGEMAIMKENLQLLENRLEKYSEDIRTIEELYQEREERGATRSTFLSRVGAHLRFWDRKSKLVRANNEELSSILPLKRKSYEKASEQLEEVKARLREAQAAFHKLQEEVQVLSSDQDTPRFINQAQDNELG